MSLHSFHFSVSPVVFPHAASEEKGASRGGYSREGRVEKHHAIPDRPPQPSTNAQTSIQWRRVYNIYQTGWSATQHKNCNTLEMLQYLTSTASTLLFWRTGCASLRWKCSHYSWTHPNYGQLKAVKLLLIFDGIRHKKDCRWNQLHLFWITYSFFSHMHFCSF